MPVRENGADPRPEGRVDSAISASGSLRDQVSAFTRRPSLSPGRIMLAIGSVLLVLALLWFGLPWATGSSRTQIITALMSVPAWAPVVMVLLGVLTIALEALTVSAAARGAGYVRSLHAHAAASGMMLVIPGGGLAGMGLMAWLLHRAGLTIGVILLGIITASLVEVVVSSVLLSLVGLGAWAVTVYGTGASLDLPGGIGAVLGILGIAAVSLALGAVLLNRSLLDSLLSRLELISDDARQVRDVVMPLRDGLVELLATRWVALLLPTLAARVVQAAAFVLALQAVGAELSLTAAVAVFALARVLSLVPITPGGAGVTETVGAAALVALGLGAGPAASAMLLFALVTLVVPVLAGGAAAVTVPRSVRARPSGPVDA